jgi:hypothetical protein
MLHDVSRRLAALVEEGMSAAGARRIPVFLCHPLDPLEDDASLGSGTVGILYPVSITPEPRLRRPGMRIEGTLAGSTERFRADPLWVRVRYVFLVAGGSLADQLGAVESALGTLHDNPIIAPVGEDADEGGNAGEDGEEGLPVRIVEDPGGWRELGLGEHRLLIALEVTLPIASARTAPVERVIARDLEIEERAP